MQLEYQLPSRINTFCLLPLLSSLSRICSPFTTSTSVILIAHCIGWNLSCPRRRHLSCLSEKSPEDTKICAVWKIPRKIPCHSVSWSDSTELVQVLNKPCGSACPSSTCLFLPLHFLYHILVHWMGSWQTCAPPCQGTRESCSSWPGDRQISVSQLFAETQRLLELCQPIPLPDRTHKDSRTWFQDRVSDSWLPMAHPPGSGPTT